MLVSRHLNSFCLDENRTSRVLRGSSLSISYPEAAPFLTNSALRQRVNVWMTRWMFRHDEYTKRCSAHAFGDPIEVNTLYDDLITTGRELHVPMPVMESYGESIWRFATTARRNG